jgi:hypothetical protein
MAQLQVQFDPNAHKPTGEGVGPLTHEGFMPLVITSSEIVPNSAKTGQMLVLNIEVTDGPDKGSLIMDRLNIENPNEKAVEIAYRTLAMYAKGIGETNAFTDTVVLHNRPFLGKIKHDTPTDAKYQPKPEVKQCKVMGSDVPPLTPYTPPPVEQQAAQTPAQTAAAGWANQAQQQQAAPQQQATPQQAAPQQAAPQQAAVGWQSGAAPQQQWQQPSQQAAPQQAAPEQQPVPESVAKPEAPAQAAPQQQAAPAGQPAWAQQQ